MKQKQLKNFLVEVELEENMPCYQFILQYTTLKKADKVARNIIKTDYPEYWKYSKAKCYDIREVTAEQLLDILTLETETI